jgi:hypothetical protein
MNISEQVITAFRSLLRSKRKEEFLHDLAESLTCEEKSSVRESLPLKPGRNGLTGRERAGAHDLMVTLYDSGRSAREAQEIAAKRFGKSVATMRRIWEKRNGEKEMERNAQIRHSF